MKKINLSEMMNGINKTKNVRCTMLGIGPMSLNLIRASFLLAKKKNFPVMFIASRNQVDADELGGGYVCSWNQNTFASSIKKIADELSFNGNYYLCRDHGGPWQRDKERNDKLPVNEAMELGKRSFVYDLQAGFDLLHIDPTKLPTNEAVVPMEFVLEKTVELIEFCETQRKKMNLAPVAYEVGTEETNGGTTSLDAYTYFIDTLVLRLKEKNLPTPLFVVGNTGTLVRLTENIGNYDVKQAMMLAEAAAKHGLNLKEHNGDYLSDYDLSLHPALGISATNVAPEYGVAETRALLLLSEMEKSLNKFGIIKEISNFERVFSDSSIESGRWRKWMVGEKKSYSPKDIENDPETKNLVVNISGHYCLNDSAVKNEINKMYANLEKTGIKPGQIVIDSIIRSIERYVDYFNLTGIS